MSVQNNSILLFCRLCQSKRGTFLVIDNPQFIEQVRECTRLKINDEYADVLPKSVCDDCKISIDSFFDYLQKVKEVDNNLRELFARSTCKIATSQIYKCEHCSATISDIHVFSEHLKTHQGKTFRCPECEKTYSRYSNFQMHIRNHSVLFCFTCETTFNDSKEKIQHTCDNVNILSDLEVSKEHETEVFEKNTSCEKSDQNYTNSYDEYKVEMVDASADCEKINEDAEDVLEDINELSADSINLQQSNRPKKKEKHKDGFMCRICQEIFVLRVDFWSHKKIHQKPFLCKWENCQKICTSAYALKTHEMKHEGKRPFLCVTCGKGFITKNSLICHEKIHLEIKGYVCKVCNVGFSVRSNLRAHEKKHHEGVRFYCSQCTREFITKCSLDRHERLHTGIKEYQCEMCPSSFYTLKELTKHQRYHQGVRKHQCNQCFKTFFEKHHLTIHLRTHTGERPYVCKSAGCNKSFVESQKLTRHIKAKHSLA